jgi:catechol 2,3-dioxygenase-like lactoylglutathione lyase family enzyme
MPGDAASTSRENSNSQCGGADGVLAPCKSGEANMAVTGIGGFFFRAKDPESLGAWYATHLGVGGPPHGAWDTQAGPSVFAPFKADTDYFEADRQWMLNLRVDGLDELCTKLRAAGIAVITSPDWDMPGVGRFARIHDPEGNPIELWEPEASG